MRRSVVLHRNWSVSLCLVVVRVPLFVFMWFSFSPPPVLREDQGGGMVTSWCNYAICLRPGIKIHCSCEAGTLLWLGGPGLLALMRSLTFSCLFFCSCFDSQRFVVAMACLTVWQAAVGNAASSGRRSELVRISRALPASFHPDRTCLPSSKGNANITILPDFFFFFSQEARRRLSVLCWNKAAPSKQSCCDAWAQGSAAAKSHMGRIRENSMPTVWGIFGPPSPEVSFWLCMLCS